MHDQVIHSNGLYISIDQRPEQAHWIGLFDTEHKMAADDDKQRIWIV